MTTNPSEANVRFLLAYHYLMLDHMDAARRQLTQVVALRPADKLAARILAGIGEAPTTNPVAVDTSDRTIDRNPMTVPQATNPDNVAPVIINAASTSTIAGTWRANPDKKVQIELALLVDGRFNWKFTGNGRSKDFSGKYELNDKALTLTRDLDGDAMEGTIERTADNGFRFRMKDAEAGDSGLSFTR
jgi:hypothetical protein